LDFESISITVATLKIGPYISVTELSTISVNLRHMNNSAFIGDVLTDPGSISVVTIDIGPSDFMGFLLALLVYYQNKGFQIFEGNPANPRASRED